MSSDSSDLILNRLPKQEWFSVGEAAFHSGWGRTLITEACQQGRLPAQAQHGSGKRRRHNSDGKRALPTYFRIHRMDLALFISIYVITDPVKQAQNIAVIVAKWSPQLRTALIHALQKFTPVCVSSVPDSFTLPNYKH